MTEVSGFTGQSILVVEDELAAARVISRVVGREWAVRSVDSVQYAIGIVERDEPFDCAVVDIVLGDGLGLDFIAALRKKHPTRPCLVLTAHHAPELINRAHQLGAEYACKPSYIAVLQAFLDRVLARRDLDPRVRLRRAVLQFAQENALTPRETEIVWLAAEDVERKSMTEVMGIEMSTLKTETHSILAKTGEPNLADIARKIRLAVRSES